jgi:hypothetical protein
MRRVDYIQVCAPGMSGVGEIRPPVSVGVSVADPPTKVEIAHGHAHADADGRISTKA